MATEKKGSVWEQLTGWATILLGPWAFIRFGLDGVTDELWETVKARTEDVYGSAKEAYLKLMVGPMVKSLFALAIGNVLVMMVAKIERGEGTAKWYTTWSLIVLIVTSIILVLLALRQRTAQYIPLRIVGGDHDGEEQTDADGNTLYADNRPGRFNLPLIIATEAIIELILSAMLITCGAWENDRFLVGLGLVPLAYMFVIIWITVSLSAKAIEVVVSILEDVVAQILQSGLPVLPNLTSEEAKERVKGWLTRVSQATKISPYTTGLMITLAVPLMIIWLFVYVVPSMITLDIVGGAVLATVAIGVVYTWLGGRQEVEDRTKKFVRRLFQLTPVAAVVAIAWGLLSDEYRQAILGYIPTKWESFVAFIVSLKCGVADTNWWLNALNIAISFFLVWAIYKLTVLIVKNWSKLVHGFEARWSTGRWFGKTLTFVSGKLVIVGYAAALVFTFWWTGITYMSTRSLINGDTVGQVCFGERPYLNPPRPIMITKTALGEFVLDTGKAKAEPKKEPTPPKAKAEETEAKEEKLDNAPAAEIKEPPQWKKASAASPTKKPPSAPAGHSNAPSSEEEDGDGLTPEMRRYAQQNGLLK